MSGERCAARFATELVLQKERWYVAGSSALPELLNPVLVLVGENVLLEIVGEALTLHPFNVEPTRTTHHVQAILGLLLQMGSGGAEGGGHETALTGVEVVLGSRSILVPMFARLHSHLVLMLRPCHMGGKLRGSL